MAYRWGGVPWTLPPTDTSGVVDQRERGDRLDDRRVAHAQNGF